MQKIIATTNTVFQDKYWQITRSGKVFELHTTSTIDHQPDQYRLGVIQIGQIIQKIRLHIKKETTSPIIQIFPNLTENQLIATVYWPELTNMNGHQHPQPAQLALDKNSRIAKLHFFAGKYRLTLEPVDRNIAGSILEKSNHSGFENLLILSESNHLFSWLRIGHWLEETLNYTKLYGQDIQKPLFQILLTEENRKKAEKMMKKKHIQGIISL